MDCCCTDRRGVQRGVEPLWLWVSNRGEQHPCWHTTFLGKSSVLYLCGADGSRNCSTPRKVWLQLRRSGGKGCPLRGGISDRKRLAGGANMYSSASRVICGTKVYQSPRQPLLTIVSEPPRQLPAQAVHCLALHLLCPALDEMEMERRTDQRVLDSIGKAIAVQQIGLLSGGQLVHRRI